MRGRTSPAGELTHSLGWRPACRHPGTHWDMTMTSDSRAPLRLRPFRRLAGTYAVNGFGDWIGEIALATFVYTTTGSALATAGLWLVQHCIPGLAAPALVARLDGIPVSRLLPALHLLQATIFATLALIVAVDGFALWLILPLVLLDGLCGPVSRTSREPPSSP